MTILQPVWPRRWRGAVQPAPPNKYVLLLPRSEALPVNGAGIAVVHIAEAPGFRVRVLPRGESVSAKAWHPTRARLQPITLQPHDGTTPNQIGGALPGGAAVRIDLGFFAGALGEGGQLMVHLSADRRSARVSVVGDHAPAFDATDPSTHPIVQKVRAAMQPPSPPRTPPLGFGVLPAPVYALLSGRRELRWFGGTARSLSALLKGAPVPPSLDALLRGAGGYFRTSALTMKGRSPVRRRAKPPGIQLSTGDPDQPFTFDALSVGAEPVWFVRVGDDVLPIAADAMDLVAVTHTGLFAALTKGAALGAVGWEHPDLHVFVVGALDRLAAALGALDPVSVDALGLSGHIRAVQRRIPAVREALVAQVPPPAAEPLWVPSQPLRWEAGAVTAWTVPPIPAGDRLPAMAIRWSGLPPGAYPDAAVSGPRIGTPLLVLPRHPELLPIAGSAMVVLYSRRSVDGSAVYILPEGIVLPPMAWHGGERRLVEVQLIPFDDVDGASDFSDAYASFAHAARLGGHPRWMQGDESGPHHTYAVHLSDRFLGLDAGNALDIFVTLHRNGRRGQAIVQLG